MALPGFTAGVPTRRREFAAGRAFRFWNPATKQWTIEPGEFEIRIGASSADIQLKDSVQIP